MSNCAAGPASQIDATAIAGGSLRATVREGGVHLVLFGAFVFLASNP